MKKRSTTFRSVVVELDCGCEHAITTSFYRLSKVRIALIFGSAIHSGCRCSKHEGLGQPVKFLRTDSLENDHG